MTDTASLPALDLGGGAAPERRLTIEPAYDGRKGSDPRWRTAGMRDGTDYGIHGCTLRFELIGALGAVHFVVYTDWHLPHVQEGMAGDRIGPWTRPMGSDVGYHAPKPQYEGQDRRANCHLLRDGCYSDGSALRAHEWVKDILLTKGSEGVWAALHAYYTEQFGAAE